MVKSLKNAIEKVTKKGDTTFTTIDIVRQFNNGIYEVNTDINMPLGKYLREFANELSITHLGKRMETDDDLNSTTTQVWGVI